MMRFKKTIHLKKMVIPFSISTIFFGMNCIGLNASATTYTRSTDNDPVASGYSMV